MPRSDLGIVGADVSRCGSPVRHRVQRPAAPSLTFRPFFSIAACVLPQPEGATGSGCICAAHGRRLWHCSANPTQDWYHDTAIPEHTGDAGTSVF